MRWWIVPALVVIVLLTLAALSMGIVTPEGIK